jgi:hypothetical protein
MWWCTGSICISQTNFWGWHQHNDRTWSPHGTAVFREMGYRYTRQDSRLCRDYLTIVHCALSAVLIHRHTFAALFAFCVCALLSPQLLSLSLRFTPFFTWRYSLCFFLLSLLQYNYTISLPSSYYAFSFFFTYQSSDSDIRLPGCGQRLRPLFVADAFFACRLLLNSFYVKYHVILLAFVSR